MDTPKPDELKGLERSEFLEFGIPKPDQSGDASEDPIGSAWKHDEQQAAQHDRSRRRFRFTSRDNTAEHEDR